MLAHGDGGELATALPVPATGARDPRRARRPAQLRGGQRDVLGRPRRVLAQTRPQGLWHVPRLPGVADRGLHKGRTMKLARGNRMDRKWWTLVAVCVATFMLLLDITVVNVALPDIQSDLNASFAELQWVVD